MSSTLGARARRAATRRLVQNAQLLLDTIPGPNETVNGGTPTRETDGTELTVVEAGGETWAEVEDCEAEDGWTWINPGLTRVRLCNAACDALLDTKQVKVEYHCDSG